MSIVLDLWGLLNNITPFEIDNEMEKAKTAHNSLLEKTGLGSEYTGWVELPETYDKNEFIRLKAAAKHICDSSEILLVIGAGGSYIGAAAGAQMLPKSQDGIELIFLGHNLSGACLFDIVKKVENKDFSINVISKSGTTTEPAIAFELFKPILEKKYGKEGAKKRIFATTDKYEGTLRKVAGQKGYETFVIPKDIGGRYSVLTPVGLLPLAAAGIDIDTVMKGAYDQMMLCRDFNKTSNIALLYAAIRNILYKKGKSIEILASYEPKLYAFSEWFKQLFGESQGKNGGGIFPVSAHFTTDLHSFGQYIQEGKRNIFETVIWSNSKEGIGIIPFEDEGLSFLENKTMYEINKRAFEGTVLAHSEGGIPNIIINIDSMDCYHFGALVYFFEFACALGGYMSGINPFDQPGVERYKKNMFALLGKKGMEKEQKTILERINTLKNHTF